jgi:Spy/CpxP family protein refolding chaperone
MSEMNNPTPGREPQPPIPAPRAPRAGWSKVALFGAALVAAVAIGAGGLAAASAAQDGWQNGWMGEGTRLERLQGAFRRALDSVGATSDQEAKVHDIVANAFAELAPTREKREAFRKQALDLLKAPTIDRAAIEKMRADHMAEMDAKSKRLVAALVDVAEILTPDQRVKLADRAQDFMQRPHHRWQWRHRPGGDHEP